MDSDHPYRRGERGRRDPHRAARCTGASTTGTAGTTSRATRRRRSCARACVEADWAEELDAIVEVGGLFDLTMHPFISRSAGPRRGPRGPDRAGPGDGRRVGRGRRRDRGLGRDPRPAACQPRAPGRRGGSTTLTNRRGVRCGGSARPRRLLGSYVRTGRPAAGGDRMRSNACFGDLGHPWQRTETPSRAVQAPPGRRRSSPRSGAVGAGGRGGGAAPDGQCGAAESAYIVVLKDRCGEAVAREHGKRYGVSASQVYSHALRGYAARLDGLPGPITPR